MAMTRLDRITQAMDGMDSLNRGICPECGGQLVAEFIGNYGDVYPLGKNGKPLKKRLRRHIYEHDGEPPMVYCKDCARGYEKCGE